MCERLRVAVIVGLLVFGAGVVWGQGGSAFEGTFRDDRVTVISAGDAGGKKYSGTIVMESAEGNRRYRFEGVEEGGELVGKFFVGDQAFEFRARIEGGVMVFRTGGTEYRLARGGAGAPVAPFPGGGGVGAGRLREGVEAATPRPGVMRPREAGTVMNRAEQIEGAIAAAKAYVYARQRDGNWDRPGRAAEPVPDARGMINAMDHAHASQWGGLTALATYALLAAGENPRDANIAAAVNWLERAEITGTYALACRAMVWNEMPGAHKGAFREQAKRDRDLLLANIKRDPRFVGMFRYTRDDPGYDHSNSQFGVLGLWAAQQCGAEVTVAQWKEFEAAWMKTQLANGGWSYSSYAAEVSELATPSMTAAGVATLFITFDQLHANAGVDCRGNVPHKAIDAGLKWIAENYEQTFKGLWPVYSLYGMERIGLASGYKYFGDVDWYKNGVDYLLEKQRGDGSWGNGLADTCFGILFLVRGRAPVVVNKLEYGIDTRGDAPKAANWNQRPRDCANLARWMGRQLERELAWQIVNLKGPVEDLHDSPILLITGNQALSFTAAEEEKLKAFVRQGGLIVGHADCNNATFAQSFTKLGTRLFSPYEFRALPGGHLVNTILFQGDKWKGAPQLRGISNGARELMILVANGDPGRNWQTGAYAGREASYEFMANVFSYVSERKDVRNRGESHVVVKDERARPPAQTVRVARLEYLGNWDPEPGGWERLAAAMHNEGRVGLNVERIRLGEGKLAASGIKVAHLTSTVKFTLREEERRELKAFVEGGGTLLTDACGGTGEAAAAIEAEIAAMFGGGKPKVLEAGHPIYAGLGMKAEDVALRPYAAKRVAGGFKGPRLRGLEVGGRLAVVYSPEDLSVGLVGQPIEGVIGYTPASATALVKAVVAWTPR